MSDSDSDYGDVDFVSGASMAVKSSWTRPLLLSDSGNLQVQEPEQDRPEPEKKAKVEVRGRRGRVGTADGEKENMDSSLIVVQPAREEGGEEETLDITPPITPVPSHPAKRVKAVRGAARTKKTQLALDKIQNRKCGKPSPAGGAARGRGRGRGRGRKAGQEGGEGVLDLSDSETEESSTDNEFEIKVMWKSDIIRLKVSDKERLGQVMDRVAGKVGEEEVGLCSQEEGEGGGWTWHQRDSTVREMGLSVVSILHARKRDEEAPKDFSDCIQLKIQTSDRRAAIFVNIRRNDPMQVAMEKFCQEKNIKMESVRFCFDGESLDPGETPETLDLDGGECIDVHYN